MASVYLFVGFVVLVLLFWWAMRSNKVPSKAQRRAQLTTDLARENHRLRHVLAELSVENHALKYAPPDNW